MHMDVQHDSTHQVHAYLHVLTRLEPCEQTLLLLLLLYQTPALLQAAQYRLELQQLKSEHAALQMLTQHTEQETVSTALQHSRRPHVSPNMCMALPCPNEPFGN
jgi:hypothetical protein